MAHGLFACRARLGFLRKISDLPIKHFKLRVRDVNIKAYVCLDFFFNVKFTPIVPALLETLLVSFRPESMFE